MTTPVTGRIHSTENFGTVDGPGVRFIVFTQGCRMRCQFCHNPDTWKIGSGGRVVTTDEVLEEALRFRSYWGEKGGITVSGGEPLLQMDFLIDLFKKAKAQGIHTTLDTCGKPFTREEPFISQFDELMKYTDLLLFDIKHIDNEQHKLLTTQDKVEVLPYHTMGKYKWEELGIPYPLEGIEPPKNDRVENAKKLLHVEDYQGYLAR